MPREGPTLNHFAFVNDMITLYKVKSRIMRIMTGTLEIFENMSRQKVNKDKSVIYMHHSVLGEDVVTTKMETGI